ncbi:GPW/gp25 family protein [Rheinheimera sp. YQF-2]|uniref:GPW/gp25 family protein n=1 Tax=Rheinheimera lutimaris TaxID=2740584 RepID=A0A7Y5EJY0_9GAMM|nr:GPW/gp25 family protein [Rheinheimera lutimaris]NRQ43801.1 GPW/gp25 family protein [Rheinheimera lutimaris]
MSAGQPDNAFLGIGWAFPPGFSRGSCHSEMVTDQQDIEQSLRILFSTRPGERVMQPEYGCALQRYVFSMLDEHALANIIDAISHAVLFFEPRIQLLQANADLQQLFDGVLMLQLSYLIRGTNSRHNMVYPFYLLEGTEVAQ